MLGVSLGIGGETSSQGVDEYELKAAILSKFVKLVSWPEERLPEKAPLVIVVFGEDPFGKRLEETFGKRKEEERKITIKRVTRPEDIGDAHVVFVPRGEAEHLAEILAKVRPTGSLLVGESEGFAARGGAINFYAEGDKLRFEINTEVAKRQKLKISSDLLKLARIVKDKE